MAAQVRFAGGADHQKAALDFKDALQGRSFVYAA